MSNKPMYRAFLNDIAQRLLTGNKRNQKSRLVACLNRMDFPENASILDFGCGTALFAPVFTSRGMRYTGYDPDPTLTRYARILHPASRFVSSLSQFAPSERFDLILANCCFHHISTDDLHGLLPEIKAMLAPAGTFLLIDILGVPDDPSPAHRWFMTLEDGQHVRPRDELESIVRGHFSVRHVETYPDTLFGASIKGFPLGNELILMELIP